MTKKPSTTNGLLGSSFALRSLLTDDVWQHIYFERQQFMIACRAYFPDCNFQYEVAGGVGILAETNADARLEYYPFYSDGKKYRLETCERQFPNDYGYKTLGGLLRILRQHSTSNGMHRNS